jgi:hypothetical protein
MTVNEVALCYTQLIYIGIYISEGFYLSYVYCYLLFLLIHFTGQQKESVHAL